MATSETTDDIETAYNNAIVGALNAAALKADDANNACAPAPIDHAAQAALENSPLTGQLFGAAYDDVYHTINHLAGETDTTDDLAAALERVKTELLRVNYEN